MSPAIRSASDRTPTGTDDLRLSPVAAGRDDDALSPLRHAGLQDVVSPHAAHGGIVGHVVTDRGPFVWVQDAAARSQFGHPSLAALHGVETARSQSMLRVEARNARDTLWAMEEAVKAGLNVVGEIEGSPRALDFTATRRLEMFARSMDVTCLLVRVGARAASPGSSGARWRWRVSPHASDADPYDPRAPGLSRWCLELIRARTRPPGRWIVGTDTDADLDTADEGAPHRLRVVSPLAAGDVDACPAAGGGAPNVLPFRARGAA